MSASIEMKKGTESTMSEKYGLLVSDRSLLVGGRDNGIAYKWTSQSHQAPLLLVRFQKTTVDKTKIRAVSHLPPHSAIKVLMRFCG